MTLTNLERDLWIETDHGEELADAIKHAADLSGSLVEGARNFRWLAIALHLSLQNIFICVLEGHNQDDMNMLDRSTKDKLLKWRTRPTGNEPDLKIASFDTLFLRVRQAAYVPDPYTLSALHR